MKTQHLIPILFLAAFCTASAQTNNAPANTNTPPLLTTKQLDSLSSQLASDEMVNLNLPKMPPVLTYSGTPYAPDVYEYWEQEGARIHAIIPEGTTFSNIVVILGSDYTTVTNRAMTIYAEFFCVLPGTTNISCVIFRVENNNVDWMPVAPPGTRFPPHQKRDSAGL
jgi:hypothetical protein